MWSKWGQQNLLPQGNQSTQAAGPASPGTVSHAASSPASGLHSLGQKPVLGTKWAGVGITERWGRRIFREWARGQ